MDYRSVEVCLRIPAKVRVGATAFPIVVAMLAANGFSQTPTQIQINSTVQRPAIRAFGMNVTEQNFWDAGQTHKNLVFRNPGFEPLLYQSVMRCVSGTANSCTDDTPWGVWPGGFWNGGQFELVSNGQTVRTGAISGYSAPSGRGSVYTFSTSGVAPSPGDLVILRKRFIGDATNASSGWWPSASGGASITSETADLPPGTQGVQAIRLNALPAGSNVNLISYFDSSAGRSYVQLNGAYRIQFKAKGLGGSNQIRVSAARNVQFVNRTVSTTNQWQDYSVDFTASENGSSAGTVNLTFNVPSGSAVLLDDVSLTRTDGDPSNRTAFRDPVVNALRQLRPGALRYWAEHLGESLDNQIAPPYGRQRAGYRMSYNNREDVNYGLHEFLELCELLGADPWIVVPIVYSPQEAASLIEYLAGSSGTPYGSRRAARGRTAPWTDAFSQIHLEYGNEAWNSGFRGGTIEYPNAYGPRAQTIFGAMRGSAAYQASKFDLVLGGQAVWIGRNRDIQNYCNNNDSLSIAPYMMYEPTSYANNEQLFGPLFAEAEMNSRNGVSRQNRTMLDSFGRPIRLNVYEMNLHTTGGTISQSALDQMIPSHGSGLAVTSSMLQMLRDLDSRHQMFYSLQQSFYGRPDGSRVKLWGAVVDMGVTDRRRPQFLALQMVNQAMHGADLMATTHAGSDPTWEQSLMNGVQLSGAHYIQSFAFRQGTRWSLALYNLSRNSALPVTFGGAATPSGNVIIQQLAAGITDNNETSEVVRINSSTNASFNPNAVFSLPAHSLTVLTWNSGSTPPPAPVLAITGVSAANVTSNSATINWVTNIAADSQVEFGTSPALGQSTAVDPAQVTTHSVTLSGLTAGTTYSYLVRSKNTNGATASSILQFSTTANSQPTALVINGAIGTDYISSSGAIVSFLTNRAATSSVSCTSASAPTVATPSSSTASTTHVHSLSGLQSGTTYSCVAAARDSNGQTATGNATFTTAGGAPSALTIGAVSVSSVSSSGAVLSWTTNRAATSQASCNSPVGSISTPFTAVASTSHSLAIAGAAPSTVYACTVTSRDSNGQTATSSAGFTTTAAPVAPLTVSAVSVSNIAATGATFSWTSNRNATSQVQCSSSAGAVATPFTTVATSAHQLTISSAASGVTYSCVATSRDSSGQSASAAPVNLTTLSTTPPPPPPVNAPQVTWVGQWGQTGSSITISWATNVPTTGYVQYWANAATPLATAPSTAFTSGQTINLAGLAPGTTYSYRVRVRNAAGVEGASAIQSFATRDTSAPAISNIQVVRLSATSARVTWTTNEPCIGAVQYGATTSYTGWAGSTSGTSTSHSAVLNYLPRGTTNYRVWTKDGADNVGTSANFTLSMP